MEFHAKAESYFMTHVIPNSTSMFNPPLHLHLYQDQVREMNSLQTT